MRKTVLAPATHCQSLSELLFDIVELRSIENWIQEVAEHDKNDSKTDFDYKEKEEILTILYDPNFKNDDLLKKTLEYADIYNINIHNYNGNEPDHLKIALLDLCLQEISATRKFASESRAAAAALRRELENLQTNFQQVENFLNALGEPKCILALEYAPTTNTVILKNETDAENTNSYGKNSKIAIKKLSQLLPISIRSAVGFDFHCRGLVGNANANFILRVKSLDDERLCDDVCVPLSEIKIGWNRLTLPVAIACAPRDALLELELQSSDEMVFLALSVGPPVPVARFRANWSGEDETNVPEGPVALRVWRGLAGVRLGPLVGALGVSGSPALLLPGDMPRAELLATDRENAVEETVQSWEQDNSIRVLPPAKGMSLAVIRGVPVASLTGLSAIVHVGHADAPPVGFAIGVVPSGSGSDVDAAKSLGSWMVLPPRGWGEVHAWPTRPLSGECDFVLATMLGIGTDNKKAWGLFRGFRLYSQDT